MTNIQIVGAIVKDMPKCKSTLQCWAPKQLVPPRPCVLLRVVSGTSGGVTIFGGVFNASSTVVADGVTVTATINSGTVASVNGFVFQDGVYVATTGPILPTNIVTSGSIIFTGQPWSVTFTLTTSQPLCAGSRTSHTVQSPLPAVPVNIPLPSNLTPKQVAVIQQFMDDHQIDEPLLLE